MDWRGLEVKRERKVDLGFRMWDVGIRNKDLGIGNFSIAPPVNRSGRLFPGMTENYGMTNIEYRNGISFGSQPLQTDTFKNV